MMNDGHRLCPKRHTDACPDLVAGLLRNVLQHTVNDIVGGETHKVTVTASHHALEDEHVAVVLQRGVVAEIVCQHLVTLGDGQVVWRSIERPRHVEPVKGVVALCAVEKSPVYDGAYHGKDVVHGVAPSGHLYPAFGAVVELAIDGGVLVHEGVFLLHEFLEGGNVLGGDGTDGKGVVLHLADAALVFLEAFHLVYDTTVVGSLMLVGLLLFYELPAPDGKASLYNLAVLHLEGVGMVVGKYELLQPLVGCTDVKLLGDKACYLHHGAVQAKLFLVGHQSHTEAVALTLTAPVVGISLAALMSVLVRSSRTRKYMVALSVTLFLADLARIKAEIFMSNDILILSGNMVLFNHLQDVSLGVIINGTVASEGNAVLCMSRK